ncbi:Pleiotropic drug resistance protein 3 [Acorus gramineus]|uniref:Pleiotropic drug resistance protein 3 n=1 Tax=Acorus gramineus TaxID=55184 RepID=A0AAV9AN16_ACOGR|nr:Pleiotropic drug resistance protein 3 [Acorus gramineus]
MELVELNSLRNSLVGLPGVNGLSTEQRKRLTIAVELVANPSIIFMDEPTSGLDARAAAIVMRTVRNTVDTGRTVVCTIHQPSIDIFEAFDEEKQSLDQRTKRTTSKLERSLLPHTVLSVIPHTMLSLPLETTQVILAQSSIHCHTTKRQDLFNAMGSMYAAVLFIGIQNAQTVQPIVDVERTVFYREKAAGMYSALPYAFAQVAIEIPYVLFQTLIYGVIVYSMINFQWTAVKFLCFLYFTYYGMMAVAVTPNSHIAAVVATAFYGIWNLFAGFVIPRPRIPIWWRWYYWACPIAWTLYGLIVSQFGDITEQMEDTGVQETVQQFLKRSNPQNEYDYAFPIKE